MKEESSKEVVINWWNSMKNIFTVTWKAIREIFSSSFHLIKEPIVTLAKALWEWIKVVATSLYKVLKSFVIDVVCKTCTTLWKLLRLAFRWIVSKFKKKEEKKSKGKK